MEDYPHTDRSDQGWRAQGNAQAVSIIHQTEGEWAQNGTQTLFPIPASSNIHLFIYKTQNMPQQ